MKLHKIFLCVLQVNSLTGQTYFLFKNYQTLASFLKILAALFLLSYSPTIL